MDTIADHEFDDNISELSEYQEFAGDNSFPVADDNNTVQANFSISRVENPEYLQFYRMNLVLMPLIAAYIFGKYTITLNNEAFTFISHLNNQQSFYGFSVVFLFLYFTFFSVFSFKYNEYSTKLWKSSHLSLAISILLYLAPTALVKCLAYLNVEISFDTDFKVMSFSYYASIYFIKLSLSYFDSRELVVSRRWSQFCVTCDILSAMANLVESSEISMLSIDQLSIIALFSILLNFFFLYFLITPLFSLITLLRHRYDALSSAYCRQDILLITSICIGLSISHILVLSIRVYFMFYFFLHGLDAVGHIVAISTRVICGVLIITFGSLGLIQLFSNVPMSDEQEAEIFSPSEETLANL